MRDVRRGRSRRWLPAVVIIGVLVIIASILTTIAITGDDSRPRRGGATPREPRATEGQEAAPRTATRAQVNATKDAFGISYIQPTLAGGTYWISNWGPRRDFDAVDPADSWFDADHGSGSYSAGGGQLRISGDVPRMYVHDPARQRQWRDVEITMYFQRKDDSDVPYAGMTAVARANHLATENGTDDLCDTRGYGARARHDGDLDFEKETAHPDNESTAGTTYWRDGMPFDQWIGYKFLVYDTEAGVKLELWLDSADGRSGGTWRKINEITDNGRLFGSEACAKGIDPQMALTNSPKRAGSESGKPNLSVYFRSDGVASDGLIYKWGSVREIDVR